jgi:hypothetical protein
MYSGDVCGDISALSPYDAIQLRNRVAPESLVPLLDLI